jgi:hypothetical protein
MLPRARCHPRKPCEISRGGLHWLAAVHHRRCAMTELEAVEAIYQHWKANWTGCQTFFEGEVAASILCGWCRVSVVPTLSVQDALGPSGARRYQRKLAVYVQIFEPIGGVAKVLQAAHDARAIFEGKTITSNTAVDPAIDFYQANIRAERIDGPWVSRTVEALCNFYEHK